MDVLASLVSDVQLPRMARVRQIFENKALADVEAAIRQSFAKSGVSNRIATGQKIAVGVGSRGMAELPLLVKTVLDELRKCGAEPFILPAMGSHGGATAEGQIALLNSLGVSEASMGAPICSSMATVELGKLPNGLPVYMDQHAMDADGIVIINRVKPHTSFSGNIESGLAKMLSIGLGKQKGADSCHSRGPGEMVKNVTDMAEFKIQHSPVLFGLATVENAYDRIAVAEIVPAETMLQRESELLEIARASMPRIIFNPLDVLIIDQMGKEFSGTGMDPNITGRVATPFIKPTQHVTRMAVLDLSDKSGGNATGMGFADITTRRLFEKIDYQATYANHITSTVVFGARIPMIMETDELAIKTTIKTSNVNDTSKLRMVRLANTLHLEHIQISEGLLAEARSNPAIEVLDDPQPLRFDSKGALTDQTPELIPA